MPEIPDANGEIQTIELVNEKTGEEESYLVHDVVEIDTHALVDRRQHTRRLDRILVRLAADLV